MTFTVGLNYDYQEARNKMHKIKLSEMFDNTAHTFDKLNFHKRKLVGFTVEAAWAQYNNAPYEYRPYKHNIDDVLGYQLRGTQHLDGGLFTHQDDPNAIYILGTVNENCDVVTFIGWSTKKRCNIPAHWRTKLNKVTLPRPAYFTSQQELWSFDLLPETKELAAHRGAF